MAKVAINGLGRIGRATFKILQDHPDLDLVAVNDLLPVDNLAYLVNHDSVYGRYPRKVHAEGNSLMIDGWSCRVFNKKDPSELPWNEMEIDLVFESTGIFRNREGMEKHLAAGAKRVILSAPAKGGGIPTVVHGVNQAGPSENLISCASCTTNCVAPVIEIFGRRIGLKKATMTTVHAYTSSQTIVDGPRNKWRRGRAAAVNFVPTTTGAAKAAIATLPQYEGRFDGAAIRGPVAVGSIADMVILAERPTSVDEVNGIFREEAQGSKYRDILGVSEEPIVSSDIIQDPRASIVDTTMTQVVDGDLVKLMSWYDNEWGYAAQMVREGARILKD